jgi:predicted nucleic-acid-binding Zn-ribbon protein
MALHPDQVAQIQEWLTAHVHQRCPACGLLNWWQIQDGCYGLPCVALDTLNLEEGLEFIATTCRACGYTAFFLASRMGINSRMTTADTC